MGIVDFAASTCLAASGITLAAPFIQTKVPAIAPFTQNAGTYHKLLGIFSIAGGALGILLIPLVLLLVVGFGNLTSNLIVIPVALLELVGCAATIVLGVMIFRRPPPTEAHSGEIDSDTIVGLGGAAFGIFLWFVLSVMQAVS